MTTSRDTTWERLGTPSPAAFTDAREQAHWAVQILVGVAGAFVEAAPDDSHTSLTWDGGGRALVTRPLKGAAGKRAGLRLPDLMLLVHDDAGEVRAEFALRHRTLADGYSWMEGTLATNGALPRRTDEMPDNAVGSGAAFDADPAALAELARWYGNAELALQEVRRDHAGASAVRVWPHHFDIATLITLDGDGNGERARSIGIGMTPGDASNAQPYFYVLPWPAPRGTELPALEGSGKWRRDEWVGAVLTGGDLVGSAATADEQRELARAFLSSAVSASHALLGHPD